MTIRIQVLLEKILTMIVLECHKASRSAMNSVNASLLDFPTELFDATKIFRHREPMQNSEYDIHLINNSRDVSSIGEIQRCFLFSFE